MRVEAAEKSLLACEFRGFRAYGVGLMALGLGLGVEGLGLMVGPSMGALPLRTD